ncbi:ribonuclease H family protein [Candidatus Wolfebacteria bacterium]|nr:ribonuclease H family protein [Candidatus Wolfebacteria bacterium]
MKNKYYAYYIPLTEKGGIVDNWKDCEKQVSGKPGARYKGFVTKKEAEDWFKAGADYSFIKNFEPGIYFDAGTGRGQGVEVSVTDEKGNNLLDNVLSKKKINKFGKYFLGDEFTNNYGELLGFKFALEIAVKNKVKKIFGDSRLVINYWSKGVVKMENVSLETLDLIDEVVDLREKFERKGGVIIYIFGKDNPADLGFHK